MVFSELTPSACKVYSLTWSEFSSSLTATAKNLRNLEGLTDVTVSAGGKIFPAHKLVLSSASPLLMELLKNTKCQHPILMLAGISASDLEIILDFIYQGEINVSSEKLPSLLQAAQFLDIRALSPSALVLNSSQMSVPPPVAADKNINIKIPAKGTPIQSDRNSFMMAKKRKAMVKTKKNNTKEMVLQKTHKASLLNVISQSNVYMKNIDDVGSVEQLISKQPLVLKHSSDLSNEAATYSLDEKKIISDLPVNCKLCGTTIRQSRNLRRHMDQRHSQLKPFQSQNNHVLSTPANLKENCREKNKHNASLLDFSEDSFSQLTEEILNCSTHTESTSNDNSFSNSLSISSASVDTCLMEDETPTCNDSPSTQLVSTSNSQSFSELLEENMCFQLTTKNSTSVPVETSGQTETASSNSCISAENFACSHIIDSCNMNDIALKELENQLFSACFCSVENDM